MNTIKNQITVIIFISLLVASSCGPEEDIHVEVSKGLKPTISWEGGPIYCLSIRDKTDDSSKNVVWSFYAIIGENIVDSPVKYGILPDSTELWLEPQIDRTNDSLVNGRKYEVYVGIVGPASGICEFIATRDE